MTLDWTSAEQAQTVARLEDDSRPAWLWPADGPEPVWTNRAAGLFGAKIKHGEIRPTAPAVPVKGQISRILRLGLIGQPTLSRMHFLAGRKPISATCRCTPMRLADEKLYLLVVGVDPIADDIFKAAPEGEPVAEALEEAPKREGLA